MMFIYNLIPKWLLAILVAALLLLSGELWLAKKYYEIDNKELKADNGILTTSVKNLKEALATCTKGLKAEADNATRVESINTVTQNTRQQIKEICVKEDPNAKTDVASAIKLSNDLSLRFNGSVRPAAGSN